MKILCDNCKREFDGKEEDMQDIGDVYCPNCKADLSDDDGMAPPHGDSSYQDVD
jgi:hypothetical protein